MDRLEYPESKVTVRPPVHDFPERGVRGSSSMYNENKDVSKVVDLCRSGREAAKFVYSNQDLGAALNDSCLAKTKGISHPGGGFQTIRLSAQFVIR